MYVMAWRVALPHEHRYEDFLQDPAGIVWYV